jgi:glutamine synthetase
MFQKRKDLIYCGRTLFGAKPPKGQEMEDHYYGALKKRVSDYMANLDEELWKMGVLAKTKHNEAAPSQHELCPIYTSVNLATDHNQIIMETMKSVAMKHGLACLLHEKPFEGINGSGKHINWSITTDGGANLFDPGNSPYENAQFLLFLTAVIEAVDSHQDLLRASIASCGNDHRLGANEAPPAIISIFLGEELTDIVNSLTSGNSYSKKAKADMEIGVDTMPKIPKDNTDRNRTSPFAFTGNKFEFRMPGSSMSVAEPNIILNAILAETLCGYADKLENAKDFTSELKQVIISSLKKHGRIIFNGNNYSREWIEEAERRGLLNLKTTVDALPAYTKRSNIDLFIKHNIYNEKEVHSRFEIYTESYCKTLNIEALAMVDIAKKDIMPAVQRYLHNLSRTAYYKKSTSPDFSIEFESVMIKNLSQLNMLLYNKTEQLAKAAAEAKNIADIWQRALYYKDTVIECMNSLRQTADELETLTDSRYWPFPTYGELLYTV